MLAQDRSIICRPCAEKAFQEAKAAGRETNFARIVDPTICGICKADHGSSELPLIGGVFACGNCSKGLYERPFPQWLKLSLAGLVLLLGAGLWRGLPYFKAGRHLVQAERAMDRQDYSAAAAHFQEVLKVHPTSQKVALLGAKANLMIGDLAGAQAFLKQREQFESDDLFTEVSNFWKRAMDAYDKADKASKLEESGQDEQAAKLMHEASSEYPQSVDLAVSAMHLDAGVAFDRKDYDAFLRISTAELEKEPNNPAIVAGVSSAMACKYAVTGDPAFRKQSEDTLAKAQVLAQRSAEEKSSFDSYSQRIRYRLATREIIDTKEYNRRFGKQEAKN
jgi:tetratricopeptide (TPR) repeat protein